MKRNHLVAVFLILSGMFASAQQNFIYISGHVTDLDLSIPVSDHPVYAACNDSLGFYIFQTDQEGYYGDTLFLNTSGVTFIKIYTFDCQYMEHDTLVTVLSGPIVADFAICTQNVPSDCENFFTFLTNDGYTFSFTGEVNSTKPASFFWDFGDGTTGDGQSVTHTYAEADSVGFLVCLTTTWVMDSIPNDSCSAVSCQEIGGNGGCEDQFTLTGQVIMGNTFADIGQVSLYLANMSGEMMLMTIQPIDSIGHFFFTQVREGNYYLLAELLEGSSGYGNYLPTYYVDAITWTDAEMITLGEPMNPYTIYLVPVVDYSQGTGEINGTVNASYDLFREGSPVPDIEIILMEEGEQAIAYEYSSDQGSFDFPSLGWGTYKVHAEVPGKVTGPAWVTLDEEHPVVTVEFMITQTEVYNTLSVAEPDVFILSVGEVYPNPIGEVAYIPITLTKAAPLSVRIFNQLGQEVLTSEDSYRAGDHLIQLNISHLDKGIYILNLGNDQIGGIIKKIIK